MKHPFLVLAAMLALAPAALAQSQSPQNPAPKPPTVGAPATVTPLDQATGPRGGSGAVQALRQGCREQIQGQGLKGEGRMKAVSACVVHERPDLAAREQCRVAGFEKGLRKRELHGYVKDCMRSKS